MNPKNPPLLKWYDPGPQEEPPDVKELMDELGLLTIMPKDENNLVDE